MFGLELSRITAQLSYTDAKRGEYHTSIQDLPYKLEPVVAGDHYTPAWLEGQNLHDVPLAKLQDWVRKDWYHWATEYFDRFTFEDIMRLSYDCAIQSDFDDNFRGSSMLKREDPRNDPVIMANWRVIWKIRNSLWHYGYQQPHWNTIVDFWNAIPKFDFGVPGFEVRLDWSTYCNEIGFSEFSGTKDGPFVSDRVFLDSTFGYMIFYKGEHILTIGVSPSTCGLLVQQIQARKKHGNRWMYKLGTPYFDHCVTRLQAAFGHIGTYLIKGTSCKVRVRNSYTVEARPPEENFVRLQALYDQPLRYLRRRGRMAIRGSWYTKLQAKS